ncbi:MAG TPA: NADH-quinone oxidoreductase subunit J [Flavobacteriales bacterium]|nr:NADH-quinone oxidoreductase subunit J [Flavobacteriales bacterium]HPH82102.1 NADH-quinone oxidoreductase subunit J [Flavobacteriales bacterium]
MTPIAFLILAALTIGSALMVVFSKNPIYSVLWLVICFFSITGHYILLDAGFLGIVNLIVYAGAIMVLFLFVIMLLNLNKETEPHKPMLLKVAAVFSACLLMIILAASLREYDTRPATMITEEFGTAKGVGKVLFKDFLLPFEVASILFISAMVGAVILGKKHVND